MARLTDRYPSKFDPAGPASPTQAKNARFEPRRSFACAPLPTACPPRHRRVVPMVEQLGSRAKCLYPETSRRHSAAKLHPAPSVPETVVAMVRPAAPARKEA